MNLVKAKAYFPFVFYTLIILVDVIILALLFPGKVFKLIETKDQIEIFSTEERQLTEANELLAAVDINQLSSALVIANVALPDEKKVAGLISGLGTVASASGVVVRTISYSPGVVSTSSAQSQNLDAIPVTMTLNSSLIQFLDYLKKLQSASQLLGVTGITYTLTGSSPGGEVNILVYYLPARAGKPSWLGVPRIDAEDLKILSKISPQDIFNLPLKSR